MGPRDQLKGPNEEGRKKHNRTGFIKFIREKIEKECGKQIKRHFGKKERMSVFHIEKRTCGERDFIQYREERKIHLGEE